MTYDDDNAWVLWPEYFDKSRSRAQGRKVNRRLAIHEPDLQMLEQAIREIGLEYRMEAGKLYPGNWHSSEGRIRVERVLPKTELLEKVARKLQAQRS